MPKCLIERTVPGAGECVLRALREEPIRRHVEHRGFLANRASKIEHVIAPTTDEG